MKVWDRAETEFATPGSAVDTYLQGDMLLNALRGPVIANREDPDQPTSLKVV